jgi:hypothetical protein
MNVFTVGVFVFLFEGDSILSMSTTDVERKLRVVFTLNSRNKESSFVHEFISLQSCREVQYLYSNLYSVVGVGDGGIVYEDRVTGLYLILFLK